MSAKVGLIVSAVLFISWIGWLGYLVVTDSRPQVVKYAQLVAASAEVVAHVDAGADGLPTGQITIEQSLWPEAAFQPGQKLNVVNLADCVGFTGAGSYLVPLVAVDGRPATDAAYRVPRTARSPGVERKLDAETHQPLETDEQYEARIKPTIYAWTAAVQEQYKSYRP